MAMLHSSSGGRDDDVSMVIDAGPLVRADDDRGVGKLDDGRAVELGVRLDGRLVVDIGVVPLAPEEDRLLAYHADAAIAAPACGWSSGRCRRPVATTRQVTISTPAAVNADPSPKRAS